MRTLISLMLIFVVFNFYSCCTKKDCESAGLYDIAFRNFNQNELDTIIIYSYSKNSNFTVLVDSFITNGELNNSGYCYVYTKKSIPDFDFKIILSNSGQIFNITDVNIEEKGCNTCFPYRPRSDYYQVISNYKINGQTNYHSTVEINN
ncbi:MAG: hypothetical protein HY951_13430 [Bacteroidia bacterium]|nr:hypothetical protein [Bacteroidia bacterium]